MGYVEVVEDDLRLRAPVRRAAIRHSYQSYSEPFIRLPEIIRLVVAHRLV